MHLFCHEYPDTLVVETTVTDARPGKVALAQSPFYPGGGGQLADRGIVRWSGGEARVTGFDFSAGRVWLQLDTQAEVAGMVEATVDGAFRPSAAVHLGEPAQSGAESLPIARNPAAPTSSQPAAETPGWVFFAANAGWGASTAHMLVLLPFLLRRQGLSVEAIAAITARIGPDN